MTISQQQIVDYLYKKIGYGLAKTDTATAKSPSNEGNASPLLSTAEGIWQASASIPATIPTGNTTVVTLYNDSLLTSVQCTPDPTTATANETWRTNLIDWIPPQFGASYQVKLYAATSGVLNPQTVGTQLFPDGSGNNDAWFFDYQAGIVNFADTNVPTALAGKTLYVVGARYTGGKGISNFPQGITVSNIAAGNVISNNYLFANGASLSSALTGTYGNANVAIYLATGTGPIVVSSATQTTGLASGALQVAGGASIGANLYVGGNLIIAGNTYEVQTQIITQSEIVAGNIYAGAYFYSNGSPLNYGNVQVAAYLASGANPTVAGIGTGLTTTTNNLQTLNANVGAFEAFANATYATQTGGVIQSIQANVGAFEITTNANLGTATVNIGTIQANLGAYQIYANANLGTTTVNISTIQANLGAYQTYANANLSLLTNNLTALFINAATQGSQINSLYTNANANTAAYLLQNPVGSIVVGGSAQATAANTGAFQVYNGASIGGNLYVGGNLIVQGNTYELQTEIITQSEIVAANIYAGGYYNADGSPFITYGNAQAAAFLTSYNGNIAANNIVANTVQIRNTLFVTNIVTAGTYGNITNVNYIFGNNYVYANGVSILQGVGVYGNANVASYLTNYSGNITAGDILTNNYLYANGQSILTGVGLYGNANVATYLPAYGGNVSVNNITSNGTITTYTNTSSSYAALFGPTNAGNYLTTPTTSALDLSTNDFTIEFWAYSTSFASGQNTALSLSLAGQIVLRLDSAWTSSLLTVPYTTLAKPNTNTWFHYAISRSSGTVYVHVNGNQIAAGVNAGSYSLSNSRIGNYNNATGQEWVGYLTNLRVNKGAAIYGLGSSFTPAFPLVAGPNTALLTLNTNSFVDTSPQAVGAMAVTNTVNLTSNVSPVSVYASATITYDGQNLNVNGAGLAIQNRTPAYSVLSGALQVAGGAGIQGNLYSGNVMTNGLFYANGAPYTFTSYSNANVASYLPIYSGNIASGNIATSGLYYPNGAPYSFGSTYSNANVAGYLTVYSGNITAGNLALTGNATAKYFLGNLYSTGTTTIVGNLQTLGSGGNITGANAVIANSFVASGNVSAGNVLTNGLCYANGSPYSFGSTYSNANVASYLPIYSGNVSAGNVLTNGLYYANGAPYSFGSTYSNANVASYLPVYGGNILVGNLTTAGVSGNISGANAISANIYTFANGVNILSGLSVYGNSNVSSYLASGISTIIVTAATQATGPATGAFQVTGGASIGANLYVGGNLIISGNTYELQTEIITQSEVVATNLFAGSYFWANGVALNFSTYANANVAAYLPTYSGSLANSSDITTLYSNAGSQATSINSINANLGTAVTNLQSLNANVGAYEIYANANVATQATSINTINANIGAFETYANNALAALSTYSNANVAAYLPINTSDIKGTNFTATGNVTVNGNLNVLGNTNLLYTTVTQETITTTEVVAGNLVANSGTISTSVTTGALVIVGGAGVSGNVFAGNLYTDHYYYANGKPFVSSLYGDSNVAAYLPITVANLVANISFYQYLTTASDNNNHYIAFYNNLSGNNVPYTSSSLSYNPNNGTLNAQTFNGSATLTTLTTSGVAQHSANVVITAPAPSTSTTTGALVITNGGIGLSGSINAGANVTAVNFVGNVYADTVTSVHGNLTLTPNNNALTVINSSSALVLPTGSTGARPSGIAGELRFNSDTSQVEYFNGSGWVNSSNSIGDQKLTGDGTNNIFTLNQITNSTSILVTINGTVQTPDSAYSVSGTQITFAEIPLVTDLIDIRFLAAASASIVDTEIIDSGNIAIGTGQVTIDAWSNATYRSAKYILSASNGTESQMSEILVTFAGGSSFTSNTTLITGANRINFTTGIVGGNVVLQATATTTGYQARLQRTYFNI